MTNLTKANIVGIATFAVGVLATQHAGYAAVVSLALWISTFACLTFDKGE